MMIHGGSPCHQTKTGTGKRKEMGGREGGREEWAVEYGTGRVPKCTILLSCVGGAR